MRLVCHGYLPGKQSTEKLVPVAHTCLYITVYDIVHYRIYTLYHVHVCTCMCNVHVHVHLVDIA